MSSPAYNRIGLNHLRTQDELDVGLRLVREEL
jgi:hypothetical protein